MSLKIFHLVFIVVSVLLTGGFAAWCYAGPPEATAGLGGWGAASAVLCAALIVYGGWFLKKAKRIKT